MSAPVTQFPAFVDQTTSPPGTLLSQTVLDTLVLAQGCLVSGAASLPVTNGTLTISQPILSAVVNTGTTAQMVTGTLQNITFTASKDTYIDLTTLGVYTPVAVANNAAAPSVTANSVRLYKAISGPSAVTSVVQLAPNAVLPATGISAASEAGSSAALGPTSTLADNIARIWNVLGSGGLTQTNIAVDNTEAAANTTLAGGSLLTNMNRIRYAIATAEGLSWTNVLANTKAAILADGTNSASPVLTGQVTIPSAIPVSGHSGLLQVGPGPFDGTSTGYFQGAANGTAIAINAASGFTGSLIDLQVAGVSAFLVQGDGLMVTGNTPGAPSWTANGGSGITGGSAVGNQMGGLVTLTMTSLAVTAGTRYNWGKINFVNTGTTPRAVAVTPVNNFPSWLNGILQVTAFDSSGFTIGFNCLTSVSAAQVQAQFSYVVMY